MNQGYLFRYLRSGYLFSLAVQLIFSVMLLGMICSLAYLNYHLITQGVPFHPFPILLPYLVMGLSCFNLLKGIMETRRTLLHLDRHPDVLKLARYGPPPE